MLPIGKAFGRIVGSLNGLASVQLFKVRDSTPKGGKNRGLSTSSAHEKAGLKPSTANFGLSEDFFGDVGAQNPGRC